MARRTYTDDDKARVFTALQVNKGNVKRTAIELGVPQQTVRDWKKEWEAGSGQPPPALVEKVTEVAADYVANARAVRDGALARLAALIHTETNTSRLATIVGIMDDKIRLADGLATQRTEVKHTLPTPEEMREYALSLTGAVQAARDRDAVIIDAEVVEQPATLGLPSAVSNPGGFL